MPKIAVGEAGGLVKLAELVYELSEKIEDLQLEVRALKNVKTKTKTKRKPVSEQGDD